MWVLRLKHWSSGSVTSVLNNWVFSPVPELVGFFSKSFSIYFKMLETFLNVCHSHFSPVRWFFWQRVCPVSYHLPSLPENLGSTQFMVLFRDNFLMCMPNICGYQFMVDGDFLPQQPLLLACPWRFLRTGIHISDWVGDLEGRRAP